MRRPTRRIRRARRRTPARSFTSCCRRRKQPFLIVGGGGWSDQARRDLEAFATAHEVPVGVSFRCQDYFDNLHPCYAGHVGIGINPEVRRADPQQRSGDRAWRAAGGDHDIAATRCSIFRSRGSRWFTSIPDPEEIGRVYRADARRSSRAARRSRRRSARLAAEASAARPTTSRRRMPTISPLPSRRARRATCSLREIVRDLSERLPDDTIICNGAGNYAVWVHRFWRYRQFRTEAGADLGLDGLWPAGGRRRQAAASRTARSSASPATAASR